MVGLETEIATPLPPTSLQKRGAKTCLSLCVVRRLVSNNVHLANEDSTANGHGDCDDGEVNPCKIESLNVDVFSREDIPPQETSERRAEGGAKSAIVDAKSHSIYRCPKCPITNGYLVSVMDIRPCLDYTAEKDGSADISSSKLLLSAV